MANSKDQNEETEFPGYPHYPAEDDIMNSQNDKRVELDVENFSRSPKVSSNIPGATSNSSQILKEDPALTDINDEGKKATGTNDADITPDDLIILGEADANFKTVQKPVDNDLDIPGTEDDDDNEEIGEEDEENNYYSLGGDAHENLEDDPSV